MKIPPEGTTTLVLDVAHHSPTHDWVLAVKADGKPLLVTDVSSKTSDDRLSPASGRADMGQRGRLFYEKHLSRNVAVGQFEASLRMVTTEIGTRRLRRRRVRTQRSGFLPKIGRRGRRFPEEM